MPRATKNRVKAAPLPSRAEFTRARKVLVRIEDAQLQCQRAERARDAAHKAVTAAYVELGRALLAGEIGHALRSDRGRK